MWYNCLVNKGLREGQQSAACFPSCSMLSYSGNFFLCILRKESDRNGAKRQHLRKTGWLDLVGHPTTLPTLLEDRFWTGAQIYRRSHGLSFSFTWSFLLLQDVVMKHHSLCFRLISNTEMESIIIILITQLIMHGILRWVDSIISINHTEEQQKYLGRLNRNPCEKHLYIHETWAEMTLQFSSWKLKLKVPGKTLDMYFNNEWLAAGLIYWLMQNVSHWKAVN